MPVPMKELFINHSNPIDIGEFIGIFAEDGNYSVDKDYRHQIRIFLNAKDTRYIQHVTALMKRLFDRNPWVYTRPAYNVTMVRIISKQLFLFIRCYLKWSKSKTETVSLINRDQCKRDFTIGYLRGLVDTDGYLDFKDRAIKYCTVSKDSAKDIESLLWRLGIRNKTYIYNDKRGNRKTTFRVTVTRDFEKFVNIIKPFHFNYIDALVV